MSRNGLLKSGMGSLNRTGLGGGEFMLNGGGVAILSGGSSDLTKWSFSVGAGIVSGDFCPVGFGFFFPGSYL